MGGPVNGEIAGYVGYLQSLPEGAGKSTSFTMSSHVHDVAASLNQHIQISLPTNSPRASSKQPSKNIVVSST